MAYVVINFLIMSLFCFQKHLKKKTKKNKKKKPQQTLENLFNWGTFFVALIKRTLKKGCIGLRLGIH